MAKDICQLCRAHPVTSVVSAIPGPRLISFVPPNAPAQGVIRVCDECAAERPRHEKQRVR